MAVDETLAVRIREALARRKGVEEKKMFGCVGVMLDGNAPAGVWKDRLVARLGPDEGEEGATTAPPPTKDEIERLLAVAPSYGTEILLPGH